MSADAATSKGTPDAGRGSLTVLLLASTLGVMGGATIAPVIEVIRQALDVGGTEAGLVLTSHSLAIAVVSPLVGRATDRFGVRLPLAAGLVVYGLGGGAGLVIDSYPVLFASRLVLGVGAAAVFTCSTAALLGLYRGEMRDKVMGWRTAATTAGGFAYPLAAGALGNHSWHAPFAIYLIGLPLGLATLLALPKATPARENNPGTKGDRGGAVRLLREHPLVLGLCGLWVASTGLMMVLAVSLPRRLDQLGVHDTLVVALYGIVLSSGAASLIGLTYAKLTARFGYAVLMRCAVGAWTAGLLLFAVAGHWGPLLLVPVLTGIGSGIMMPTLTVLVDRAAPAEQRGTATSLQATALFGGQFGSPLVFGPLIDATSIATGALVAAAGTAGILVALFRLQEPAPPSDDAVVGEGDLSEAPVGEQP
ncbi:MFS transporter [Streptomyces sp. NL15-2K]|uniref:MFS transporter n=1 Tax=Streptomyces sp. NL15-2K TaxID=376149 RepID=UPI000F57C902|nr:MULTISPECIES: MFS transporter [Actinomycetes]WKX11143.1 MFS transporter [Kutzneria buriramensis]GCB52066.1 MFS permease [Streptomyces sp. NL15-2K]